MKKFSAHLLVLFILCCVVEPASAQFNQNKTAISAESKTIDSVTVKNNTETGILKVKVYNEAYDRYLRDMQFKQRNFLEVKSALRVAQTSFDNWAAGGNNSFSGRAFLNVVHIYTAPTFNVKSVFDSAFGIITSDGLTRKNEDFFNLSITPSWKISGRFELSGSLVFRSQFADSYQAPANEVLTSAFLAPGYLTPSIGITYFNKKRNFTFYVAPASGNLIMVTNQGLADKGAFGVKPGEKFKVELGLFNRITFSGNFMKNKFNYTTKMENFWSYENIRPSIWWENKLTYNFTNLLSADLYVLMIYNDKINTPSVKDGGNNYFQFTESFGFGISYHFKSKSYPAPPEPPRKHIRTLNDIKRK